MATIIACLKCQKPLNVPPEAVGGLVHCPYCQTNFVIPRNADGTAGAPEYPRRRFRIPTSIAAPGFALLAVSLFGAVINLLTVALVLGKPGADLDQTRMWVQQLRSSEDFEAAKDAAREKSKREVTKSSPKTKADEPEPAALPPDDAALERLREQDEALARAWVPLVLPMAGWSLLASSLGALAGLSLLRGRWFWLAGLGSLAAMTSINNLCCVPSAIAAVWALLVLIRDDGQAWFGRSETQATKESS